MNICVKRLAAFERKSGTAFPKIPKTNTGINEDINTVVNKPVVLATLDSSFRFIRTSI